WGFHRAGPDPWTGPEQEPAPLVVAGADSDIGGPDLADDGRPDGSDRRVAIPIDDQVGEWVCGVLAVDAIGSPHTVDDGTPGLQVDDLRQPTREPRQRS